MPAAAMIALGAPTTHIAAGRPEVQAALRHASRLPGDPVDHLERCLDDTLACLHSPKVRHTVAAGWQADTSQAASWERMTCCGRS